MWINCLYPPLKISYLLYGGYKILKGWYEDFLARFARSYTHRNKSLKPSLLTSVLKQKQGTRASTSPAHTIKYVESIEALRRVTLNPTTCLILYEQNAIYDWMVRFS